MKSAILYVRVSTDEQARRGYSQRDQEDRLRAYCEANDIEVEDVYREDHSAKTFNRPEWNKLILVLKKRNHKRQASNILFVKWDRFSRNVEAAYQMIALLRTMNTKALAVDQPVDFSVPESKVILSVYLTIPEVENDRRAMNVFYGMRRAKKEGRWMGQAPLGYMNRVTPDGKKYITFKPKEANLMRWVFDELSKGILNAEQVRKLANTMGLKCERNNFWKLIRNPMYCGYIVIPPHENEEIEFVPAQHEPLISKSLFYEVQDVLNGNKRPVAKKANSLELLPLRGFLICPLCDRTLTGSASRGRHGKQYHYYHCQGSFCKFRFKAKELNTYFEKHLLKYKLSEQSAELFKMIITDVFQRSNRVQSNDRDQILALLEEQEAILSSARKKYVKDEIDDDDFIEIKKDCNSSIKKLEEQLAEMPNSRQDLKPLQNLLNVVMERYKNIDKRYLKAENDEKRQIVGSMYPENILFDGKGHRTPRMSEPLGLILLINKRLSGIKKGEKLCLKNLSPLVARRGLVI